MGENLTFDQTTEITGSADFNSEQSINLGDT